MNRLLVETAALGQDVPELDADALRHMKVWRLKDGEGVELFDGSGRVRLYRYRAGIRRLASAGNCRFFAPPRRGLVLFACVTKGSRWDWTLEKATELGVSRIVPVVSERTIVRIPPAERAAKQARWRRIVEDAARQSGAVWLPEIEELVDFPAVFPLVEATQCFVGALTEPPPPPLLAAVRAAQDDAAPGNRDLALFVGPEGDFTPEELAELLRRAAPASFGPTVLRAETAALYGLSVLAAVLAVAPAGAIAPGRPF